MAALELSRRERQILDTLYRLERATAAEIQAALDPPPHYSTLRAQLRVLEEKGHVRHAEEGLRYVYFPSVAPKTARRSALRHLLETFFDGSAGNAVAALLGGEAHKLSREELDRISRMIEEARKERA
jgi:predicted transcriptional regulator